MMSGRPSVGGGRLGGKPAANVKEVYSFPLLQLDEIVEVLREMGVVVGEDDLQKPKPDTFRQWCELFVLEILAVTKEDIYTPSRLVAPPGGGADGELHDDSVPVVHFLRKTNKVLLAARCDEGLSLRDVMKPEKQRVQRVLSALINLYKFRQEKIQWFEENVQKTSASVARKQELLVQIEHLQQAIAAEMRAREAEQPEVEAAQAQMRALESQRDGLTGRVEAVRTSTDAQKEEIRALKEQAGALARTAEELRGAVEAKRAQIVSSPDKAKAEVAALAAAAEAEQAGLDAAEAERRLLARQGAVVAKAHKDVTKAVSLMAEAEAEAVKLKRVLRDEKARKAEAEAVSAEVEGLRGSLEHAEAGRRRALEKAAVVAEEARAHAASQARALGAISAQAAEFAEAAKQAASQRRFAENEKMRLEARKEQLISSHAREVSDILSSVKHLASSVQGYHGTLFGNLAAVNSMAPVGSATMSAGGAGGGGHGM